MTIRFRLISEEDDNFLRDVEIDSNSNFIELHNFLQETLNFEKGQMASFFTTDNDWQKEDEITLMDMNLDDSSNTHIMSETRLNQFITQPKQRLLYVFDFFNERNLFMEVYDIANNTCIAPKLLASNGEAPQQLDIQNLFDDEDSDTRSLMDNGDYDDEDFNFNDDFDTEENQMISYTDNIEDL